MVNIGGIASVVPGMSGSAANVSENNLNAGNPNTTLGLGGQNAVGAQSSYGGSGGMDGQGNQTPGGNNTVPVDPRSALPGSGLGTATSCMTAGMVSANLGAGPPPLPGGLGDGDNAPSVVGPPTCGNGVGPGVVDPPQLPPPEPPGTQPQAPPQTPDPLPPGTTTQVGKGNTSETEPDIPLSPPIG
jgi:hypothetical protein